MSDIRRRIQERAAGIRREREQRVGFWRRLTDWLAGIDREAERRAEERRQERDEARRRANAAFPAEWTRAPGCEPGWSAGYRTGEARGWLRHRSRDDYRHMQE